MVKNLVLSIDKIGIKLTDANFPTAINPWFKRGGYWGNGTGAGVFYFNRATGNAYSHGSARLILAP